jgi:hypothetical protein
MTGIHPALVPIFRDRGFTRQAANLMRGTSPEEEGVMSRMRFTFALAGASLAAGAAGCALGLLFAPASGAELRRRLTWGARDQVRSAGRAWELMVDRAAERTREEFKKRRMSCAS